VGVAEDGSCSGILGDKIQAVQFSTPAGMGDAANIDDCIIP
jgi:hypothetical protein